MNHSFDSAHPVKYLTKKEAKEKLANFCAYQERSQMEARDKLYSLGIKSSVAEEIIAELITENFLNEERFAKTYAGGKFRIKKWGKVKIMNGLKSKGIEGYCMRSAMNSIDENDYKHTLEQLIKTRFEKEQEGNIFRKKDKTAKYAISKGYEPELVWRFLHDLDS